MLTNRVSVVGLIGGVAAAVLIVSASQTALAGPNYNSSKSNTGNVTLPLPHHGKPSKMAIKNSGVPKNTTTVAPPPTGTPATVTTPKGRVLDQTSPN
jgi:hypothetical protein